MPFPGHFTQCIRAVGLEPKICLSPKQLVSVCTSLKDDLWGVLLMQCPIGDAYAAGMHMHEMKSFLQHLHVPIFPSLDGIEIINSKAYSKAFEDEYRFGLSESKTIIGSTRCPDVRAKILEAITQLQARGCEQCVVKRGWSYEGMNVEHVHLGCNGAAIDIDGIIARVDETKNWKKTINLDDVIDPSSSVTIVQRFNSRLSRMNEYRTFSKWIICRLLFSWPQARLGSFR